MVAKQPGGGGQRRNRQCAVTWRSRRSRIGRSPAGVGNISGRERLVEVLGLAHAERLNADAQLRWSRFPTRGNASSYQGRRHSTASPRLCPGVICLSSSLRLGVSELIPRVPRFPILRNGVDVSVFTNDTEGFAVAPSCA